MECKCPPTPHLIDFKCGKLSYIGFNNTIDFARLSGSDYWVSREGDVIKKGKIIKSHKDAKGYKKVRLTIRGNRISFRVHRLVMEVFEGGSYLEVNHKNGIKDDNRLDNLEYVTSRENQLHAIRTGLKPVGKGEEVGTSKLTGKEVIEIRGLFKPYKITRKQLANKYNVSEATIKDVVLRKSWKHL